MQFSVNSTIFLNYLLPVLETSQKGVKEFFGLNKVNLNITKNNIKVSSYNGSLTVEANITELNSNDLLFNFIQEGNVTIPSDALKSALMSFPKGEEVLFQLEEKDNKKSLYIKQKVDTEQYQTIPCCESSIEIPEKSKKIVNDISISKEVFVSAVKNIDFAFGSQKGGKQQFLYWILRVNNDNLRFASGTGAIFAILDVCGKDAFTINSKTKEFNLLLLNEHSNSILSILDQQDGGNIKIQQSDKKDVYQIIIESGMYTIIMCGLNTDIEWIDENVFLTSEYDFKTVSKISDWDYACKGANATFTEQVKKEKRPRRSIMNFDFTKNLITVQADEAYKSSRKVEILDKVVLQGMKEHKCATYTDYLSQIPECWNKDGTVQIHMQVSKTKSPIVVYFNASDKIVNPTLLKKINPTTGIEEKFAIIFIQLSL